MPSKCAVKSEIKTKIHEFPAMFCSVFLTRTCKILGTKCGHMEVRASLAGYPLTKLSRISTIKSVSFSSLHMLEDTVLRLILDDKIFAYTTIVIQQHYMGRTRIVSSANIHSHTASEAYFSRSIRDEQMSCSRRCSMPRMRRHNSTPKKWKICGDNFLQCTSLPCWRKYA